MEGQKKPTVRRSSTISIPIDYAKYVVCGEDYIVNEHIRLHNPTLEEIISEVGEEKYLQFVSLMIMRPYDDMVALDDAGINYMDCTDYEVFLRNYKVITPEYSRIVLGDIDLTKFKIAVNDQNGNIVLMEQESGIVIDELIYSTIASYIRKINFISAKVEYDAGNETMRRYLIEKKRKELKKKKKKKSSSSFLANVMSLLCSVDGSKYNYQTIRDIKISQLYDCYYRINVIEERRNYLNVMCSGMVKMENKDSSRLNWTRELNED